MKKEQVLLDVSFIDNKNIFWQESYIKNKIFNVIDNDINKTVAEAVLLVDYITLLYKNKPQANVYIDDKNRENSKVIGYIYRGKTEIQKENGKYAKAVFDVWVTIKKVEDYPIIELIN